MVRGGHLVTEVFPVLMDYLDRRVLKEIVDHLAYLGLKVQEAIQGALANQASQAQGV